MDSRALSVHCWGWTWQISDAIRSVATAWEPGEILFCFFLSGKQRTISPISRRRNFTKFGHKTLIGVAIKLLKQIFNKFTVKGPSSQKTQTFLNIFWRLATSGRHNSAMIIHRRKFTIKLTLYGVVSIFTVRFHSKSFTWDVRRVQESYSHIFQQRRRPHLCKNLRAKWPTPSENADLFNSASAVRASKNSIISNRKSTMSFPSSHRWTLCVTHKSLRAWLKTRIFTFPLPFIYSLQGNRRHFKFGMQTDHSKSRPTDDKLSLKLTWSRYVIHFKI